MLSANGIVNSTLGHVGLNGPGFGITAVWLVESYLWLPFMILPIYAGLERIPNSMISASEDLGANPWKTFRRGVFPLAFPAVVAGAGFIFPPGLGAYVDRAGGPPGTQVECGGGRLHPHRTLS